MNLRLIERLLKKELDLVTKLLEKQEAAVANDPSKIIIDCLTEADQCLKDCRAGKITEVERNIKMKSLHEKNEVAKMRLKTFNLVLELDKLNRLKMDHMEVDREYKNIIFTLNIQKMRGRDATET